MRAAGADHGMPKRFSTLPFTCGPSPSSKRPPESCASAQASCASSIGLRAKATATPVATRSLVVAASASVAAGIASYTASGTTSPSHPSRSARCACPATAASGMRTSSMEA